MQQIFFGGIGGMLPRGLDNVLNYDPEKFSRWLENNPNAMQIIALHALGYALLFALGALVVVLYNETQRFKAFLLGVGAPAVLATLVNAGASIVQPQNPAAHTASLWISQALAQQVDTPQLAPPQTYFQFDPAAKSCAESCVVTFSASDGTVTGTQNVVTMDGKPDYGSAAVDLPTFGKALPVPAGTANIWVGSQTANPTATGIDDLISQINGMAVISAEENPRLTNEFLRALGASGLKSNNFGFEARALP